MATELGLSPSCSSPREVATTYAAINTHRIHRLGVSTGHQML
jgi:hypothetical protein